MNLETMARICQEKDKKKLARYLVNEIDRGPLYRAGIEFMNTEDVKRFIILVGKILERRERRNKIKMIKWSNRAGNVFYLCSKHNDSGEDHADYQGKIYVNRYWRSIVEDDKARMKVEAYIRNHDTKSIQDVMNYKPYLITRPYCRHNMIAVPIDTVLNNGVKTILREYNTKDKTLTPSHAYKRNVARVNRALENKKPVRI